MDQQDHLPDYTINELEIVYIATNPSMPGLVKIGRTKNLASRLASMSGYTSVPEPFEIPFAVYVADAPTVEQRIHAVFSQHRLSGREFFRIPLSCAIAALALASDKQAFVDSGCNESEDGGSILLTASKLEVLEVLASVNRPMSNRELSQHLKCSEGEASKRWQEVRDQLDIGREGKELRLSLRKTA